MKKQTLPNERDSRKVGTEKNMKKLLLLILTLALLASACIIPASAADASLIRRPNGYYSSTVHMVGTVSDADMEKLCNNGDDTYDYRNLGTDLSTGLTSSSASGTLTNDQKIEVANISYGISLIGVTKLDRRIAGIGDGVWTTGNTTLNGLPCGAGGWTMDTYFYNANGETNNDELPSEDYPYASILTYNFGAQKRVDYMICALNGNTSSHITGIPVAGDIYTSDDGVNWTLRSYWDMAELRQAGINKGIYAGVNSGRPISLFHEKYLGKDATGSASANDKYGIAFCLEGITAQYVRLAFTCGKGITKDSAVYADLINNILNGSLSQGTREIILIGGDPIVAEPHVKLAYEQTSSVIDDKVSIRLISEIDSTAYASAGFHVQTYYFTDTGAAYSAPTAKSDKKTYSTTTVYESLLASEDGELKTVAAKSGKYFAALTITDIPVSNFVQVVKVTPFVMDGEDEIDGASYCVVYLNGVFKTAYTLPLGF